jgi:hypothetical protein
MTSPRPTKTFRKKPQEAKSFDPPEVVYPSLKSNITIHRKVEPAERPGGDEVDVEFAIGGFRKRKVFRQKILLPKGAIVSKRVAVSVNFDSELQQIVATIVEEKVTELLGTSALGSSDRFKAARSRGNAYKAAELAKAENAPLKEVSNYSGTSDRLINKWRNEGSIYALVQEGKSRGYRYPLWQFDAERSRLSRVLAVLREANASDWVIHNFLLRPSPFLDGRSPRDWILDPGASMEHLVQVARDRFSGDQGAS